MLCHLFKLFFETFVTAVFLPCHPLQPERQNTPTRKKNVVNGLFKNRSEEKLLSFKSIFCLKFKGAHMGITISLANFRPTRMQCKKISHQGHNILSPHCKLLGPSAVVRASEVYFLIFRRFIPKM